MMIGLVWIIGSYAAGVAFIHWLYRRWKRGEPKRTVHYILRTYNNQLQIEWFIRTLYFFSRVKGRTITVTLVDEGSTDDTLMIVSRLSFEHQLTICKELDWDGEKWVREHKEEQVIVVRLNQNEGLDSAYKYLW